MEAIKIHCALPEIICGVTSRSIKMGDVKSVKYKEETLRNFTLTTRDVSLIESRNMMVDGDIKH